jgi:hypothetical protein
MAYQKNRLLVLAKKVDLNHKITPDEINELLSFEKKSDSKKVFSWLKTVALPLSLGFGFFFTVFPKEFDHFVSTLPAWTNLTPPLLSGVDYLWSLLGDPVGKANILFHVPNIILYSFGIFGVKKLFDALDKRSWLDRVLTAQTMLNNKLQTGHLNLSLKKSHTLLFVGRGDYIGTQFALNHKNNDTVTISENKPSYTNIWNYYFTDTMYEDLKNVIERSDGQTAGEYVFFPVKDDQIFLPAPNAYDLSPHKLDIICQDIRTIEKKNKWKAKRIIIVGDRFHQSIVQSEDKRGMIKNTRDTISLESISEKYPNITVLDPTDIVLRKIMEIAAGRRIVFRATRLGITEYKDRFYNRLELLKYKIKDNKKGILTIGYDIFEDQTEQQMLSRKVDDYYPVVLSKNIRDALIRNGYKKEEFLYVPELVLSELSIQAAEQ